MGVTCRSWGEGGGGVVNQLTHLLHLGAVLRGGEGGRVALLLQVHLHELIDGQLTGGRVLKLRQPDGRGRRGW